MCVCVCPTAESVHWLRRLISAVQGRDSNWLLATQLRKFSISIEHGLMPCARPCTMRRARFVTSIFRFRPIPSAALRLSICLSYFLLRLIITLNITISIIVTYNTSNRGALHSAWIRALRCGPITETEYGKMNLVFVSLTDGQRWRCSH